MIIYRCCNSWLFSLAREVILSGDTSSVQAQIPFAAGNVDAGKYLVLCSFELGFDEGHQASVRGHQGGQAAYDGEQADEGQVQGDHVHGEAPRQV